MMMSTLDMFLFLSLDVKADRNRVCAIKKQENNKKEKKIEKKKGFGETRSTKKTSRFLLIKH